MTPFALVAGLALAAQPAASPYYYCEVTRTVPFGNVTVLQYVATAGVSEPPVTTWWSERAADGIVLLAAWNTRAEMAGAGQGGELYIGYRPSNRSAQYRVEVIPIDAAPANMVLRSELQVSSRNGLVGLRTHWAPVMALVTGRSGIEARALSADGAILRWDRITAPEFDRALRIAGEIQPEFETMVANYRERCRPVNSNGH